MHRGTIVSARGSKVGRLGLRSRRLHKAYGDAAPWRRARLWVCSNTGKIGNLYCCFTMMMMHTKYRESLSLPLLTMMMVRRYVSPTEQDTHVTDPTQNETNPTPHGPPTRTSRTSNPDLTDLQPAQNVVPQNCFFLPWYIVLLTPSRCFSKSFSPPLLPSQMYEMNWVISQPFFRECHSLHI